MTGAARALPGTFTVWDVESTTARRGRERTADTAIVVGSVTAPNPEDLEKRLGWGVGNGNTGVCLRPNSVVVTWVYNLTELSQRETYSIVCKDSPR
jgi:hypothetical protein